jgi:DNA-binding CsgD family transcriptional regulator
MFENPEQAFGGTARLLALIESIYAAVNDPSLWPSILDRFAEAAHGNQTFMFTDTSDPAIPSAMIGSKTDPATLTLLLDYYGSINIFAKPAHAVFRDGDIRYSHLVVPDAELERSEFYNDFFKPFDMHYSYGVNVPLAQQAPVYISCQRPKYQPAFSEREGLVLKVLMPHVQRAFSLHQQLSAMRSGISGLESALDSLEHAVFGLNREGRVVLSNRRAETIVRTGDAICLVKGVLSTVFPEQNRRLRASLSDALSTLGGSGLSAGASLLVDRKSGKNPLRVTVTPIVFRLPGSSAQIAALVFVSDPASVPQSRGATLRALYALTPSEARVADLLLQGLETRDVANRLGLTLETARFHVKRILAKTGVKRQTELMRMMLSLPQC